MDHTVAAKQIHEDKGRILAGIKGEELANIKSNLNATNMSINRSKKQDRAVDFIQRNNENREMRELEINRIKSSENLSIKDAKKLNKLESLNKVDENKLREKAKKSNKDIDKKINHTYYNSESFINDTLKSSSRVGTSVAIRQGLGFVFTEVLLIVSEDMKLYFQSTKVEFELDDFMLEIANSFKTAFDTVQSRFKDIIEKIADGFLVGVISDISNTITNIFIKSSKLAGKIIRQSWSSIVEAVKILIFNKDRLSYANQIKEASKIIFTSVSVILGSIIQVKLSEIIMIPLLKDIVPIFVGSLVTGITSISILYFIDNSPKVESLVNYCNNTIRGSNEILIDFEDINKSVNDYASELFSVDYQLFASEIEDLHSLNNMIYESKDVNELNNILGNTIDVMGIKLQYSNIREMDDFINDSSTKLIF